jgi:carbon storage regulator
VLVITRKLNEAIIIGDGIEITVLRVGRDGVRIGVSARPDVPVHRREVYDEIRAANASSQTDPSAIGGLVREWSRRTPVTPA